MKTLIILSAALVLFLSGCQSARTLSPTETMKALNDAAKAKDAAKTKSLVSKGTLDLLEESAKKQKTTVDALLQNDGGAPFQELPEMQNEKIAGDAATVEIKNSVTGEWQPMPFVKENGTWKVALDKVLQDAIKQADDQMKTAPNSANTNK